MNDVVLITGTGRTGTTVMIKILSLLGLDTGFQHLNEDEMERFIAQHSRGGLETQAKNIRNTICKSPNYWNKIPMISETHNIKKVFVPIRDLKETAMSRSKHGHSNGGLCGGATDTETQMVHNTNVVYQISLDCATHNIPLEFVSFDQFINNKDYAFDVCQDISLSGENKSLEYDVFSTTYDTVIDISKITTRG